jgi:hypothetical protein
MKDDMMNMNCDYQAGVNASNLYLYDMNKKLALYILHSKFQNTIELRPQV